MTLLDHRLAPPDEIDPKRQSALRLLGDTVRGRGGRSRALVAGVRVLLLAAWLGSWELSARTVIDPFYYSMPSQIWDKLVVWFTQGTSSGSIWSNILATLQEAVYGFVLGSIAGVVLGIVLGRSRFLSDVLAPFIKAANAIPRIVLASLFVIWFGLGMSSKVATAFVLVFFGVFFNAFQGAREVDRTLVDNARILGASRLGADAHDHPAERDVVDPRVAARRLRLRAHRRRRRRVHRRRQGPRHAHRPGAGQLRRRRHLRGDDHHTVIALLAEWFITGSSGA